MAIKAKRAVAISIRFPKLLGDLINTFCRETVRNKTDVVNAALWYLFNRPDSEIEDIVIKYGKSGGRMTVSKKRGNL